MNSVLSGRWERPPSNCALTAGTSFSNDVHYLNITTRFPTNTRGNEIAYASWFLANVQYDNVVADFNLTYNTIETGSAPTVGSYGSIGLTSTVNSSGNWQDFRNTFATGYDLGYDFLSEHITGTTITSIYCNHAAEWGRVGGGGISSVFHPGKIIHFIDQENLGGIEFGPNMAQGSSVDLDIDFELGSANWYARSTGAMTETNPGYTSGIIRYTMVLQGSGIVSPSVLLLALFSSGGQFFQGINSIAPPKFPDSS